MNDTAWSRQQKKYDRKRDFWLYMAGACLALSVAACLTYLAGSTTSKMLAIVGVVSFPVSVGAAINYVRYVAGKPKPVLVTLWTLAAITVLIFLGLYGHWRQILILLFNAIWPFLD